MNPPSLSVVVAVQGAQENLPEILRALDCERQPQVEFLICHTAADPDVRKIVPELANVRVLTGEAGSLIPHLWRDGIGAARAPAVAVTTAHCIPSHSWVQRILEAGLGDAAGVGGLIENDADSDALGWAIYLLRYASFAPPQPARQVEEIAADNAVYRREELLRHSDLLRKGFWEPSFHARFRSDGLRLALDPGLVVVHRNRYGGRQFFGQRFAHGREFGLSRATRSTLPGRILLLAASPVLPLVFLSKIVRMAGGNPRLRTRLAGALPWLLFFLLGWGSGEAAGYAASLVRR